MELDKERAISGYGIVTCKIFRAMLSSLSAHPFLDVRVLKVVAGLDREHYSNHSHGFGSSIPVPVKTQC